MKSFSGKVATITGAGSGIGQALAINLAGQGAHLALADIQPDALHHTAQLAQKAAQENGHQPTVLQTELDVANREAVYHWANQTASHHGAVHLVFNNAGVAYASPVEAIDYDQFEWLMNINFWGVVYGSKAFLPHLQAAGQGHIVNISSVFGLLTAPTQACYNASKFAVRGFTEALRQELDLLNCGVSASCVHPGGIRTQIARNSHIEPATQAFLGADIDQSKADFEKFFITSAEKAATTILKGVQHNKRRILVGPDARAAEWLTRLLPQGHQALVVRGVKRNMGR